MSAKFPQGLTESYRPAAAWRWLTFLPLGIIAIVGTAAVVAFAGKPHWWWAYAIMAIPTIIAIFLTYDFCRISLHLSETGLRYDSVGYGVEAPWSAVSRPGAGRFLLLEEPDVRIKGWLRGMARIVAVLVPRRSRRATGSMRVVPLHMFDDRRLDATLARFLTSESLTR